MELSRGECRGRAWRAVAIRMRHRTIGTVVRHHGHWPAEPSEELRRPAATGGMPQDGKDEIEMVGVQGHETADIFDGLLAKCERLDEGQNVAFSWRTPRASTAL